MKRENGAVLHTKFAKGLGILVDTIIRQFSKIIKEFIYERSKKSPKIGKIAYVVPPHSLSSKVSIPKLSILRM